MSVGDPVLTMNFTEQEKQGMLTKHLRKKTRTTGVTCHGFRAVQQSQSSQDSQCARAQWNGVGAQKQSSHLRSYFQWGGIQLSTRYS